MKNLPEITNLVIAINNAYVDKKIPTEEHATTIAYIARLMAAEGITWEDVEDNHRGRSSGWF